MSSEPRVILLEFNELSPPLMSRFMAAGKLPNFQRFYREAQVYTTEAAERAPYLDPWIQWVTVHSGLDYAEHGIFRLNEGPKLKEKRVWDLLSDAGFRVWICGSMSVSYHPPINGCVVPDPWTTVVDPFPETLKPYFSFVQRNVLEYTKDRVPLSKSDYARFLAFMMKNGLSSRTIAAAARQLLAERGGTERWKRAVILDKLQFDVFRSYFKKVQPHFSTFFLNSTAHYQHFYWRSMEPELFKVKPSAAEQAEYETAIQFGYQEMDGLLGRFMDLAGGNTTLVFCTAISQQPYLLYEEQGGRSFYRPIDFSHLLAFAGAPDRHTVAPVMAQQFHVYFDSEAEAQVGEDRLKALRVNGRQLMAVHRSGADVFTGSHVYEKLPKDAILAIDGSDRSIPFFDVFYQIEGMKSGMHHPDGLLWIRTPDRRHAVVEHKVPLADVAPTMLEMFSLPQPAYMKGKPLRGRVEAAMRPARASAIA